MTTQILTLNNESRNPDIPYHVEHDRDWTWLHFDEKPGDDVLDKISFRRSGGSGLFFWGKRRKAWYAKQAVTEDEINALLGNVEGSPHPTPALQKAQAKTDKLPGKFRDLADKLSNQIEEKRRPMSQNYTPKRQKEYMGRMADADHLERTQRALYALADARESDTLPPVLEGLKSKSAIHELLYTHFASSGYYDVVDTGKFTNTTPEGLALQALIGGDSQEQKERRERKRLDQKARELVGQVPGYFPTPDEIITRMLDLAGIESGMKVLEPSAGSGNMALLIRERGANVDTIEINYTLVEILKSKGFEAQQADFLEVEPGELYDAVIMNPPFENRQDVQHVKHAYTFLKPGGRLVSIMSEGTFFRSDCAEFREWLSEIGYDLELEAGAFKESGTNIKTRIIVIEK